MSRDLKRQIIKERAETNRIGGEFGPWANYQREVYGDDYKAVSASGTRHRHYHHNPVVDRHAAKTIGFRAVVKNIFSKLFRKPRRREALG